MPRHLLLFLLLLLNFSPLCTAQYAYIDSLKNELARCTTVSCRMEKLSYIGSAFYAVSPDSALQYTDRGIAIARSDTSHRDSMYYNWYTVLLNNSAFINQKKGNYYNAILLYQESIAAYEAVSDSNSISTAYLNLATLYNEIGESDAALKAVKHLQEELSITDNVPLAKCQIILGEVNLRSGNEEAALNHFTSAFSFYKRSSDTSGMAHASCRIGQVYFARRDYGNAEIYFRDAQRLVQHSGDASAWSESSYHLAALKHKQGETDSALFYATLALEKAREINFPSHIRDAAFLLYEVYSQKGNTAAALEMHVLYKTQDDILRNQDAVKIATREQLKADFEAQQVQERAEQERNQLLQEENIRRQKIYTWSSVGIGTLLLLLLIIAVRSYRTKQKSEAQISAQKQLLEVKNKEIEDSIVVADRIQRALFPPAEIWKKSFPESFVFYRPKDIVSGDFYWTGTSGNYTYVACCDSTGHGVPGAFVSLLNISFLNEAITERKISEPGAILDFVRNRLTERLSDERTTEGMDGILLRFDSQNKTEIAYAAAHNRPVIIRNKTVHLLETNKMPVGKWVVATGSFDTFRFATEKDDLLVLYSDGFADQFGGPQHKKFKYKALDALLAESSPLACAAIESALDSTFTAWKGNAEQTDDVLVIGIRV